MPILASRSRPSDLAVELRYVQPITIKYGRQAYVWGEKERDIPTLGAAGYWAISASGVGAYAVRLHTDVRILTGLPVKVRIRAWDVRIVSIDLDDPDEDVSRWPDGFNARRAFTAETILGEMEISTPGQFVLELGGADILAGFNAAAVEAVLPIDESGGGEDTGKLDYSAVLRITAI